MFPRQTSWQIELVSMLTNSRSLCLSNPYIVGGLVAGLVTLIPVLEIRRPAGISDRGHNYTEFDVPHRLSMAKTETLLPR